MKNWSALLIGAVLLGALVGCSSEPAPAAPAAGGAATPSAPAPADPNAGGGAAAPADTSSSTNADSSNSGLQQLPSGSSGDY
ncbi:MAG: hypothetical protein LCH41_01975 [Armatimonadetes bacterium]|nr:hypothetical protein [Armatimonadota bacterium]